MEPPCPAGEHAQTDLRVAWSLSSAERLKRKVLVNGRGALAPQESRARGILFDDHQFEVEPLDDQRAFDSR
jgi:hypothetical protein